MGMPGKVLWFFWSFFMEIWSSSRYHRISGWAAGEAGPAEGEEQRSKGLFFSMCQKRKSEHVEQLGSQKR